MAQVGRGESDTWSRIYIHHLWGVTILRLWVRSCFASVNSQHQGCGQLKQHTHTHPFNGPFPGLPGWASTRKVKPSWTLLKQETVSGSGIGWTTCKSAPRSRQITMLAPHHSVFYRPDALPAAQPTVSKHWWDILLYQNVWFVHHQSPENSEWTKMFRAIMRHHVDSQVFAKHRGVLHWKCLHRTFVSSMECSQRLPLLGRIPTTPACFIIRPIK